MVRCRTTKRTAKAPTTTLMVESTSVTGSTAIGQGKVCSHCLAVLATRGSVYQRGVTSWVHQCRFIEIRSVVLMNRSGEISRTTNIMEKVPTTSLMVESTSVTGSTTIGQDKVCSHGLMVIATRGAVYQRGVTSWVHQCRFIEIRSVVLMNRSGEISRTTNIMEKVPTTSLMAESTSVTGSTAIGQGKVCSHCLAVLATRGAVYQRGVTSWVHQCRFIEIRSVVLMNRSGEISRTTNIMEKVPTTSLMVESTSVTGSTTKGQDKVCSHCLAVLATRGSVYQRGVTSWVHQCRFIEIRLVVLMNRSGEISRTTNIMEKVPTTSLMVESTSVTGSTTKGQDKVCSHGLMVIATRGAVYQRGVTSWVHKCRFIEIRSVVLMNRSGEISRTTNIMEKVPIISLMAESASVTGSTASKQGSVLNLVR